MSTEGSTVFVVDDDVSVREALRNLFRSVGLNVKTFGTAQEFLANRYSDDASCLVLDVRLPGLSGLDLQRQLFDANVTIPILFITGHGDIQMSVRAMKAGAIEFLTKPFRDQELLDAIHIAVERDRARLAADAVLADLRSRSAQLTAREREVMGHVVVGHANKQIAIALGLSEITVKAHRGQVMRKMRAGSLAELVRMADRLSAQTNEGDPH